jgi:hypothetical protein
MKGSKNVWTKSITADFHLSVVAACSANGHVVPPTFILPGVRVPRTILDTCVVENAAATTSESGFINEKLFLQWLCHFSSHIPDSVERPVILCFDGFSSHVTIPVVEKASQLNVILLCLPPNATHLVQPLDIAVFSTFKKRLREAIQTFNLSTRESNISKSESIRLASEAWRDGMLGANCVAGFRASGLFPPNLVAMNNRLNLFKGGKERKIEWLKSKEEIRAEVLTLPPPTHKKKKRKTVDVGGRILTKELLYSLQEEKTNTNTKAKRKANSKRHKRNGEVQEAVV